MLDIIFTTRVRDIDVLFKWNSVYSNLGKMGSKEETILISYTESIHSNIDAEIEKIHH